ncbi:ABC transporter permease [Thermaerobacter sp. PB12/4term]|uniref:ABC transporter permease n=1 Tax=Thermaerobacter sp. PB12/4term TaxID=2293838 RepID=UPI000E32895F|nr:ABC transporter permease [Thermaerobacter sp. PB12/4term]QIA27620.1 ABC transporter permease [Thermaerobacter sp. PB12/4term]
MAPESRAPERARRGAFWRRFRRNRPAVVGLVIVVLLTLLAILAPVLTSYDPQAQKLSAVFQPPSREHPLGTDHLGRDMAARLLYGARYSLAIGALAVAIGLAVGVPLGVVSGYYGGFVDLIIQRVTDILLSFPTFLLALLLVAALGVGVENAVLSVGIGTIPAFVRIVRGVVLVLREQPYVEAARSIGASDGRVIFRHILVNAWPPVIVQATLSMGSTILVASGLGFLGLGVPPGTPEWGAMLGEGRQYIFSASHLATIPGVAIFLAVLAFNLVGDGLRDALDPRLRNVKAA